MHSQNVLDTQPMHSQYTANAQSPALVAPFGDLVAPSTLPTPNDHSAEATASDNTKTQSDRMRCQYSVTCWRVWYSDSGL